MKIIISPAKKMRRDRETLLPLTSPVFLGQAREIMDYLRQFSMEELQGIWGCSKALAEKNYQRLQEERANSGLTPAILAYEGIQFQYMAPAVFEKSMLEYVQQHLRILSGVYGLLRPMDGIVPYRLEMQASVHPANKKDLYDFWGERLYHELFHKGERVLVNLASREYSKAILPYLREGDRVITCQFLEPSGNRLLEKGTYAKMARGEMVRFLAENKAEKPDSMKAFDRLAFSFSSEHSQENHYVFLRRPEEKG